jgi:hypothetical protein
MQALSQLSYTPWDMAEIKKAAQGDFDLLQTFHYLVPALLVEVSGS